MDGSIPSVDVFVPDVTQRTADDVSRKLRGGVWERSELARGLYTGVLGLGRWLSGLGVTPNSLTYSALVLAVASGVAAAFDCLWLSAALLVVSGVLDLLDGIVARAGHQTSRFGALLDSTVDRLSDALPLMGLAVAYSHRPAAAAVLVIAIVSGFAVSYVRARAEGLGVSLPPLFMRRAERIVLLVLALLVGAVQVPVFPSELAMFSVVGFMALLSSVAAVWALRAAYLELEPRRVEGVGQRSEATLSPAAATPSRP